MKLKMPTELFYMSVEALEPLDASAAISIKEGVSSTHSATCSLWWCTVEEAEKFESGSVNRIKFKECFE